MVYGHMMYDETVFGPLRNYQRKKLFKGIMRCTAAKFRVVFRVVSLQKTWSFWAKFDLAVANLKRAKPAKNAVIKAIPRDLCNRGGFDVCRVATL